ncbi:MAG TPA: inositol monophosphatase family protein [Spirochaetota bacterium]|nr:inositol monophosphatase family protein [Spirochaetota bacterium]HPC39304.1 inositol monophosphatase family protein [Spirochaetota bacterium]HPL15111.1 inositol monophosphatase family protein [Spirochaetota bacterium]HQF08758.1 inositol monophosphatase family protein [Spirochaetota bacterium]HQH97541.1 inositol monophosphatase family protein [Spirochaetota bacterium]
MIRDFADFAREISLEAGSILLRGFRSPKTVISYKSKTDLVTDADRASEQYLVERISERFPDHTIIAEEGSRKEAAGDYIWYVDPLDGTNNYAHGLPFFCVSIGVYSIRRKQVVAAVVFNPFLDELFSATRGGGAFLDNNPISVSLLDDIGVSLVATGFPYDKATSDSNNLKEFNRIVPRIQGIRRMGSAAIDLSYVACGRIDGYWEGKLKPWDMAAGSLIVEEAGGRVTTYTGGTFNPEFPEVVASNGRIHEQLISLLDEDCIQK